MIDYKKLYPLCGLLPQDKDIRDYNIEKLIPMMAVNLPRNHITDKIDIGFDQGRSSTCCACAYSAIRYLQEKDSEQSEITEPFSPSFTYANRLEGEDFEGMFLRSCCKKGRDGSVPYSEFEGFYSYNKTKKLFEERKEELLEKAKPFRISSFYTCTTDEEIKLAIYTTKAVLIGINVTNSFYTPDEKGYINFKENENSNGGHALMIDTWFYDDNNIGYWRILNSWGDSWGDDKYCYVKMSDLRKYLMDDAYAVVDEITEIKYSKYREMYKK